MTTPRWFDPRISYGHILQAVVLVIGGVIAFYSLKSDVRSNSERVTSLEKIQAIEMNNIKASLNRIEREIDRFSGRKAL